VHLTILVCYHGFNDNFVNFFREKLRSNDVTVREFLKLYLLDIT